LKNLEVYSFVSTTKPKTIRKTASQLAAEKRKREELARKNKEDALEKKQAQAALAQKQADEKEAKRQEEIAKKDAAAKDALNKKQSEEALALKLAEEKRQQELAKQTTEAEEGKRQEALVTKTEPVKQPDPVIIKTETVKVDSLPKQQIGGPRLRQEAVASIVTPPPHEDEHGEAERITRLDLHDDNPTEHHEEDPATQPHAERHEFVQKGDHQDELDYGDYIVVGVFKSDVNAKHFSEGLANLKFSADYGHLTLKNLWYVYLLKTESIDLARAERDKYRKMKMFRDAWLLTVHD
jgi:flagellar biosynthesis GTPase FlhF